MLSKCLNSRCSATFHYLGRGRLFRIDFEEAGRKSSFSGQKTVAPRRGNASSIEYFWLCELCEPTMTIELSDAGEVRLVQFEIPAQEDAAESAPERCKAPRQPLPDRQSMVDAIHG